MEKSFVPASSSADAHTLALTTPVMPVTQIRHQAHDGAIAQSISDRHDVTSTHSSDCEDWHFPRRTASPSHPPAPSQPPVSNQFASIVQPSLEPSAEDGETALDSDIEVADFPNDPLDSKDGASPPVQKKKVGRPRKVPLPLPCAPPYNTRSRVYVSEATSVATSVAGLNFQVDDSHLQTSGMTHFGSWAEQSDNDTAAEARPDPGVK